MRIEMRRHQASGPRSLPLDLPDMGRDLGPFVILGVWTFHYTGACFVRRIEYPTGEQVVADPQLRDEVIRNYNRRTRIKQRLRAVIVPETSADILIGASGRRSPGRGAMQWASGLVGSKFEVGARRLEYA